MKMLTLESIIKIWKDKTGGELYSSNKNVYSVTYNDNLLSKVYDFKSSNLLKLAEKLKIIPECNELLDKRNIYTEQLYKTITGYEKNINELDINNPDTYDAMGFGATYEESKKFYTDELENYKMLLNRWSLSKEV